LRNNYGLALAQSGKIAEATQQFNEAARLDPASGSKYFYNLGAVLSNSGQNDAAIDAFRRATEIDPPMVEAFYQYASCLIVKAVVDPSGKITPPPGTEQALSNYLRLMGIPVKLNARSGGKPNGIPG
jgi:tetratricopeptide (TPR) repeat protein